MELVAEMTKDELKEMIAAVIEQKIVELFGNSDNKLPIRKKLQDRLLMQKKTVANGERGELLSDVARRLGLD